MFRTIIGKLDTNKEWFNLTPKGKEEEVLPKEGDLVFCRRLSLRATLQKFLPEGLTLAEKFFRNNSPFVRIVAK